MLYFIPSDHSFIGKMAEVKLDELESYDSENIQDSSDYAVDNGAELGEADSMNEDPVCKITSFFQSYIESKILI